MNFKFKNKHKDFNNISKKEVKVVQGIVLVHVPAHFDLINLETFDKLKDFNKQSQDNGVHYFVDGQTDDEIYSLVDTKYQTIFLKGSPTYISKALFSNPTGNVIYVYIHAGSRDPKGVILSDSNDPEKKKYKTIDKDYYEKMDKKLIKFLVTLLRNYNLTANDVWRGFDLDQSDYSPLHLLDQKVFERYIKEIEKFIPPAKTQLTDDVKGNPKKFIECIAPGAVKGQIKYGVKASLTLAQAALESGWGKSGIGNNLFGIKCGDGWEGKKQLVWTTEVVNGTRIKIQDWFRDYDSVDESVEDHAKLLTNSRYAPVIAAKDYREACRQVQACGYATDPNYATLLISMIEQYDMDKYDSMTTPPSSDNTTTEKVDDDKIVIESPIKITAIEAGYDKDKVNDFVNDIYWKHKDNPKEYAAKFKPWDKDYSKITKSEGATGEIKTRKTPYGNNLTYQINTNAPKAADHCVQGADSLEAVEDADDTMVEPIYPDLITPPGDNVSIADGFSETKVQSNSNTPLSVEEFEKRQKVFDISDFSNMKKETKGRPINVEDAFPVDDQIKKLEEHYPKVKIDKTTFNFIDTNHPDSEIGNAMAKNLAMSYDMVMEVAKRTEQRLVKIENNLSTVMRNLFRMSSRVNINCVYYGGQSIYGKYKCIRCLHDDRINDGAIVTIDQCMNCTRYEPILGQVYAILDETGSNIVQVMDDLQMSYMGLDDYKTLSSINEYYDNKDNAKVTEEPSKKPTPFIEDKWKDTEEESKEKVVVDKEKKDEKESDDTKASEEITKKEPNKAVNGFKMDWTPSKLELQKPHINEYDIEGLKAEKKAVSSDNEGIDRTKYIDTREDAVQYEELEFNIDDYKFDEFGTKSNGSSAEPGNFGIGSTEVRNKIVEYAKQAVQLCAEGKARYSQDYRYNHLEKAIGGISFWDCSSLVEKAYESAGITGIGTNTYTQYPYCLDSAGGIVIPIKEVEKALPGDMIFFKAPGIPKTKEELQGVNVSGIHHVAIYIGDNQYAHASSAQSNPNIKISTLGYYDHEMCFGRPKKLIELDEKASQGVTGSNYWNREAHGIDDALWNECKVADGNAQQAIDNMNKYKYKDVLINVAKKHNYDPYMVLALMAIESGGNPRTDGGSYKGIMQTSGGSWVSGDNPDEIGNQIDIGLSVLDAKIPHLKNCGWTGTNLGILMNAYNAGEGATTGAAKSGNLNIGNCTIGAMANVMRDYIKNNYPTWGADEKKTYPAKILRAYNYLYSKNVLS